MGRLLAAIASATADGTWARLKICRNDACRWSFYDASRNRSGHWCSMAVCGNRMKGRAFRQRQGEGRAAI
jgi:predicted RNA-binding Zn ribbon-like protein